VRRRPPPADEDAACSCAAVAASMVADWPWLVGLGADGLHRTDVVRLEMAEGLDVFAERWAEACQAARELWAEEAIGDPAWPRGQGRDSDRVDLAAPDLPADVVARLRNAATAVPGGHDRLPSPRWTVGTAPLVG
jgi:hypothetical protein